MYETEYGTEWSGIETAEAIERAYALGVAETLGEQHPDELERLRGVAETPRDRAIVQLAYDKGRNRGSKASTSSDDADTVWSDLVSESERETVTVSRERDLPSALRSLPLLGPPGDDLDRVRLPKFLLRR